MHVILARREKLAALIEQHRFLPVKELCRRFGVSEATMRRDLAALHGEKRITRTFGGALKEFNERFPSFRERQHRASRSKTRVARLALGLLEAGKTYFFDSGTTVFSIAEAFRDAPVTPITIVTSNLPVGEMLAAIPGVEVFQLAGQLLHLQSTLLGETAQRSLEFWHFDWAFLSTEGMTPSGLWNSQIAIVEQQKVVLRRSARHVFCVDSSKLNRQAPHFLIGWNEIDTLLTDVPIQKLHAAGIMIDPAHYLGPDSLKTAAGEVGGEAGESAPEKAVSEGKPPVEGDLPVHFL
ncbi:MAG: DeoR/GlpR family DNA-binding transcription regulator [Chthoniobacteraceae bacterium]